MWRNGNPGALLVGLYIGTTTTENTVGNQQKIKSSATIWSSKHISGYVLKKMQSLCGIYICTPMFTAALLTISKTWKQHQCSPIDKWEDKIWSEYNGILFNYKKKEILPFVMKWMDLSKITHIDRHTAWYCLFVKPKRIFKKTQKKTS